MKTTHLKFFLLFGSALLAVQGNAAELLVSNYFGDSIGRYDLHNGALLGTISGHGLDGTLATRIGPDGLLYVASEVTQKVLRFNATTGAYVDTFVSGTGLAAPTGITFDAGGNVLVSNFDDSSVAKFSSAGSYVGRTVTSGSGGLSGPDVGTVVGPDGNLYVPSFYNNRVLKYNGQTGAFMGNFIAPGLGGLTQPRTLIWRDHMVWMTSDSGNRVLRYGLDGSYIDTFVTPGSGGLSGASGMAFGEDGYLYVSSWRNNRVIKYDASTGAFVTSFISTGLSGPVYLNVVPEPTGLLAVTGGFLFVLRRRRTAAR